MWQLAALAVLATVFTFDTAAAIVAAGAAAAVLATSVRLRGLCGYQWAWTALRFLLRRHRGPVAPAATPVRALEPRLTVHTQIDRLGNRTAVASLDEQADFGVTLRVAPADRPDPARLISLLRKAFDSQDIPLSSAQLVVWAMPGVANSPVPVRISWLALRYRLAEAPWAALARGGGADGARRAAASAALRLVSELATIGYAASVLDTPELHQELSAALGTDPDMLRANGSATYRGEETWRGWSIGKLRQACFVPRSRADALSLIGRCVPESTFTTTSYAFTRTARGAVRTTAVARIGVPKTQFWLTPHQAARKLGLRLLPADGRHRRHVLASLPLALG
ncbi:MAG TPA: type VII secretion protein EccE [Actinophytocola sp.]|nr:type VII secretion protein EccE [Actinophytocola sp.]